MPADCGERKRVGSHGGVACDPPTSCIVAIHLSALTMQLLHSLAENWSRSVPMRFRVSSRARSENGNND